VTFSGPVLSMNWGLQVADETEVWVAAALTTSGRLTALGKLYVVPGLC